MNIKEYFIKMKSIEEKLLNFLDQIDNEEENYENFINIINDENILKKPHDFKIILYLINKISCNHHRFQNFYNKIEQILKAFKEEITRFFSNEEIFKIFKSNNRILLFLNEEKIFTIDRSIYKEMISLENNKRQFFRYREYFSFEIKSFIEEDFEGNNIQNYPNIQKNLNEDFEKFNEKRKKGVSDGYLNEIIRKDLIDEFITYVKKNDYPLNSLIYKSCFETNEFLLKQIGSSLISYAAFYGSTQIFKYLYKNKVPMTPYLWLYAIHGCDEEIIHILEENNIKIEYKKESKNFVLIKKKSSNLLKECIKESIKCHHDYVTNYIIDNFLQNNECTEDDIFSYCLEYYNFIYLDTEKININNLLIYACKYDYYQIFEFLLNTNGIDLNNYFDNDDI